MNPCGEQKRLSGGVCQLEQSTADGIAWFPGLEVHCVFVLSGDSGSEELRFLGSTVKVGYTRNSREMHAYFDCPPHVRIHHEVPQIAVPLSECFAELKESQKIARSL